MEFTEDDIRAMIREEIDAYFNGVKNLEVVMKQPTNQRPTVDRTIHEKHIQLLDARNIQFGRTNGTQIGTASDQKLGLWGVTPVVQPNAISAASGGTTVDSQARTAIVDIINKLKNVGITK
jgi:hypothetical protein